MENMDQYDYDVKENEERPQIPFTLNFKTITAVMQNTQDSLKEWDDKYPKYNLIGLLAGILGIAAILICFTYKALVVATLPMLFFYFLAWRSVFKTWKQCGYSKAAFIIPSIITVCAAAVAGYFVQGIIF